MPPCCQCNASGSVKTVHVRNQRKDVQTACRLVKVTVPTPLQLPLTWDKTHPPLSTYQLQPASIPCLLRKRAIHHNLVTTQMQLLLHTSPRRGFHTYSNHRRTIKPRQHSCNTCQRSSSLHTIHDSQLQMGREGWRTFCSLYHCYLRRNSPLEAKLFKTPSGKAVCSRAYKTLHSLC